MSDMVLYETQKLTRTCNTEKIKLTSVEDVFNLKQIQYIKEKVQEHMIVITLNNKHFINSIELVGIGSSQCVSVRPADILRCALIRGSTSIIVAHNHPSGDNKPSKVDIEFTSRLSRMARVFDIEVLDHIIVGDECLSMKANNYMRESSIIALQENEAIVELKQHNSVLQDRIDKLERKSRNRCKENEQEL